MEQIKAKLRLKGFPVGVYLLLIAVVCVFLTVTQGTVSPSHLLNIARSATPLGIAAMGQTIVLLVGGIDLSLGATISMVNLVAASVMNGSNQNIGLSIVICMALCLVVGLLNGIVVAKFKMQPFLVTMAMSIIIEGGYYIYTKGIARGSIADGMRFVSEGWIGIMPVAVLIWLGLWAALSTVLRKTTYGHKLYHTGANPEASRLSGNRSDWMIISGYVMGSMLAGVAGLMLSAYIGVASVGIGGDYTLNSIAAAVIGGTAFTGGIGSLEGTFPGVLIIVILQSLMTIMGISEAGKFICQGVVIAVMVALNQMKLNKQ